MQPIDSCLLADAAVWACQTQCRNNHLVNLMAQLMGSDGAKILGSKITVHSMKYIFIVQESECIDHDVPPILMGELLVLKKIPFIKPDAVSKISTLAHLPCYCKTYI